MTGVRALRFSALFGLFVTACLAPASSAIISVYRDSPNGGWGTSWGTAFLTVTAAIAASVAGYDTWVAGDTTHTYRESIALRPGIRLHGGFKGHERSQKGATVFIAAERLTDVEERLTVEGRKSRVA